MGLLRSKCARLRDQLLQTNNINNNDFNSVEVNNEKISSSDLEIENLENYYDNLIENYPFLRFLLVFLFFSCSLSYI